MAKGSAEGSAKKSPQRRSGSGSAAVADDVPDGGGDGGGEKVPVRCSVTGQEAMAPVLGTTGKPGVPKGQGWKKLGEDYYSPEGLSQKYACRAITVPVDCVALGYSSPFPETEEGQRDSYAKLRLALAVSWRRTTQLCNWMLFRLAGLDSKEWPVGVMVGMEPGAMPESMEDLKPAKGPGKVKLPPFSYSSKEVYQEARRLFPEVDSQSLGQVLERVKGEYKKERFDIRIRGSLSLRTYRFPQPLPCPEKDSELFLDGSGRVCVKLRVSGQQFKVRLRSDPGRYGRQLAPLKRVIAGELIRGACLVRDHGKYKQTLITVPIHMPKDIDREATESFLVRTDPGCLLVGEIQGRNVFLLSEGQLGRWQASMRNQEGHPWVPEGAPVLDLKELCGRHRDFVQQMSEDRKAERRGKVPYDPQNPRDTRRRRYRHGRNMQRKLEERCGKHERRVSDAIHKIASVVVNHAVRRRVCVITYDDRVRSYMPWFPYHRLELLIAQKADAKGIKVVKKDGGNESAGEETRRLEESA